jgi:hypothetical protein
MESNLDDVTAAPLADLIFQGWGIEQKFSEGPVGRRTAAAIGRKGELVIQATGADTEIALEMLKDMIQKREE